MSSPDLTGPVAASAATSLRGGAAGGDATATPSVRAAIARAAQATGVDFSYLLAQAKLESSLNPKAHAATSSASGLYQFTNATWAQTLARHGDALGAMAGVGGTASGPGGVSAAMQAALSNPTQRAQLMALRGDPQTSALMAAELAGDNQVALTNTLGRPPDASELYLAHFLGSDGASKFLSALSTDPAQSAAALLPSAAASNRSIFYDASGNARPVGAVMALVKGRMEAALQATGGADGVDDEDALAATAIDATAAGSGGPVTVAGETSGEGGPIAREFAAAQADASSAAGSPGAMPPSSMADTLAATFGLGADSTSSSTPDFVRAAYGRMQQLGL